MKQDTIFDQQQFDGLYPKVKFSRRGFLASSVATGFALAAGPVAAQTAIKTSADGLEVGSALLPVPGGNLPTYFAAPKKAGRHPVVIVLPEIFGMHEYQRDLCRRLAKAGYYGIALDPYFRFGDLSKNPDIKQVLGLANSLEDATMLADLDALVNWVELQPKANARKLGLTGMCRGGRNVWIYVAHSKKVRAAVAWYGHFSPTPPVLSVTPIDVADRLNAPVLGLYGADDASIPQELIERMRAGCRAFEKTCEIHTYPGAGHAFHADYRPTYRKEAAEDGWKRMLAWFKKHGVA